MKRWKQWFTNRRIKKNVKKQTAKQVFRVQKKKLDVKTVKPHQRKEIAKNRVEWTMNKLKLSGNQRSQMEKFLRLDKAHTKRDFERIEKFYQQVKEGTFNYKRWIPRNTPQRDSLDMITKESIEKRGKLPSLAELFSGFNRSEFYLKNKELVDNYNANLHEQANPFEKELRDEWNKDKVVKLQNLLSNIQNTLPSQPRKKTKKQVKETKKKLRQTKRKVKRANKKRK